MTALGLAVELTDQQVRIVIIDRIKRHALARTDRNARLRQPGRESIERLCAALDILANELRRLGSWCLDL